MVKSSLQLSKKLFQVTATVTYTNPRFSAKSDGKHVPESSLFIYGICLITQRPKARAPGLISELRDRALASLGEGKQKGIISTIIEAWNWKGGPHTAYAPVGAAQLRAAVQSQLLYICVV